MEPPGLGLARRDQAAGIVARALGGAGAARKRTHVGVFGNQIHGAREVGPARAGLDDEAVAFRRAHAERLSGREHDGTDVERAARFRGNHCWSTFTSAEVPSMKKSRPESGHGHALAGAVADAGVVGVGAKQRRADGTQKRLEAFEDALAVVRHARCRGQRPGGRRAQSPVLPSIGRRSRPRGCGR